MEPSTCSLFLCKKLGGALGAAITCAVVVTSRKDLIKVPRGGSEGWIPVDRECYSEQQTFEIAMGKLRFGDSKALMCGICVDRDLSRKHDRRL